VEVLAVEAEGELVGDGLADHVRAGIEQLLDSRGVRGRRRMARQPIRIAATGHAAGDVEDVLGGKGKALERAARGAVDFEVTVRAEGAGRQRRGGEAHVSTPSP
jgi:hypothetical protein